MRLPEPIRRLIGTARQPAPDWPDTPMPDRTLYVMGDIHGALPLFEAMMDRIAGDIAAHGATDPIIVCVGDYIDRGRESAGVLHRVSARQADPAGDPPLIALRGNHEDMMREFLADTSEWLALRWLQNGGVETLQSFGVAIPDRLNGSDAIDALRDRAAEAIPAEIVAWIDALPRLYRSGDVAVVHAALDPQLPPEAQSDEVLSWARPSQFTWPRPDGLWVAHGHTITVPAEVTRRRIAVDTGAVATGTLTAAVIAPGKTVRFIEVS